MNRHRSSPRPAVGDAVLSIRNLRVDFPGVVAVRGLSLDLAPGDATALIGPNGSGKTTTMRAIAGLAEPTTGEVRVAGRTLGEDRAATLRALGFMPDFSPVYEKLTAWEFLDHFRRAHGVGDAARIDSALELVRLAEARDRPCGELSRGMKQRLLFAKTVLHDPAALVLDEPASGLDPIGRREMREAILALRDAGRAILVSSHILSELEGFCNRVAVLERGRLVMEGPVAKLAEEGERRAVLLRVRGGDAEAARARDLLAARAGVAVDSVRGTLLALTIAGGDDAHDAALASLVGAGVRVAEWRRPDPDLERVLLASGAKELA
jgi:ABC-2 type transport system ATP-binding protein